MHDLYKKERDKKKRTQDCNCHLKHLIHAKQNVDIHEKGHLNNIKRTSIPHSTTRQQVRGSQTEVFPFIDPRNNKMTDKNEKNKVRWARWKNMIEHVTISNMIGCPPTNGPTRGTWFLEDPAAGCD